MILYDEHQYDDPDNDGELLMKPNSFTYSIANSWDRDRNDNSIKCVVTVDNIDIPLYETLRFGTKGSNGTSNTFFLEMLDNKNALTPID